jgi:predicted DNA-binding transcriptional regulator AlpA
MTHHLVGATEVAELLGCTRQWVNQLAREDPTFPAPEAELSAGRIWKREAVEAWAMETGRTI